MHRGLKGLLLNRNTVTLLVIGIVAGAWNIYVSEHDDGILEGRVVDVEGRPAADVKVVLLKQELIGLERVAETRSDPSGSFRFSRHNQHRPLLVVEQGGRAAPPVEVRLMFRNQNRVLTDPLHIPGGSG